MTAVLLVYVLTGLIHYKLSTEMNSSVVYI